MKVVIIASPIPIKICTNTIAGSTTPNCNVPERDNSKAQNVAANTTENQLLMDTAINIFVLGKIFLKSTYK